MGIRLKHRNTIDCGGQEVRFELVRRSRVTRNVYLELAEDGGLRVVAPRRMSERSVRRFLQHSPQFVLDFLARAHEKRQKKPFYRYREGEQHLYLGCLYSLELTQAARSLEPCVFNGRTIPLTVRSLEPDAVRDALRRWYRVQAMLHFQQRLEHFSREAAWTSGRVPPLRLRRMKRTMGSCSRSGNITMNPHMMKAPAWLLDYVIAHEVCHLKEHNHGPGFYRLMDGLYPDWRAARAQLRQDWLIYQAD